MSERRQLHSDEAEASVLGGMMQDAEAVDTARELLRSDDFYHPAHGLIFAALGDLRDEGHAPDSLALREALRKNGRLEEAGGSKHLAKLVEMVPTAANVAHHASIIRDYAVRRTLRSTAGWIAQASVNGKSTPDLLDEAEARLFAVTRQGSGADEGETLGELIEPALKFASSLQERTIRTGLGDLDEQAGGLRPSEFTILAARPSQGKTALAIQIAYNAATKGARVGFVSLEMGLNATALRFLSCSSGVPLVRLFRGTGFTADDQTGIAASRRIFSTLPISITTKPRNVTEIRSFARRLARDGLDLLVVDYLQLLEATAETRAAELGVITRGLKLLALELDVAILAAAQLNRTAEQHNAPRLSDLKDSGSQEQDADNVWCLWRPDFGMTNREAENSGVKNLAKVLIAKHRNGPTGMVELSFIEKTATFGLRTFR